MNQHLSPEMMIPLGDVELCVQTFGDTHDPAILLIHMCGGVDDLVGERAL